MEGVHQWDGTWYMDLEHRNIQNITNTQPLKDNSSDGWDLESFHFPRISHVGIICQHFFG